MVIAGQNSVPWAYMVCIEDIFSAIKVGLGGEGRVGLPANIEHQTQPLLDQSALEMGPDTIDDFIASTAPGDQSAKEGEKAVGSQGPHIPADAEAYVRGCRLWVLISALMLSTFLVGSSPQQFHNTNVLNF
jgi:hypothetical protein